jgi:hypothetical protein
MALVRILLSLLLALCVLLGWLWTQPEPPGAAGQPHPLFETMMRGGPEASRLDLWLAGTAFGALAISLFVALVAFGLRRDGPASGRGGRGSAALWIGWLLYLGVFLALSFSYRSYAIGGAADLVLGFPRPTAWMLFGLWPAPLWFVLLYVLQFDRRVLTKEELRRFEDRVAERRRVEEGR